MSAYGLLLDNCIIEDNVAGWGGGVFVARADAQIYDCIFRNNTGLHGAGGAHFQDETGQSKLVRCQFISNVNWGALVGQAEVTDCAFVGNSPGGLYLYSSPYYRDHVISNCLFLNNGNSSELGTGAIVDVHGTDSGGAYEVFANCTFVGNSGPDWKWGNGLCVSYAFYYHLDAVKALNCVFRDGGSEIWEIEAGMVVVENCCVEGGWEGAGQNNFDVDPQFVSGPLGDYYLSQTAAGQDQDSPCVDAGSTTALEARMSDKGTRTDGFPDGGTVDLGWHYPIAPIGPEVCVSTPSDAYSHGDTLEIMFAASNPNPYPYPVDVYTAIVTTDGVIWMYSGRSGWWDTALGAWYYYPWFTSLELPANFAFGPTTFLTVPIPSEFPPISAPGTYYAAAAFAHIGTTAFIGKPSLSAFELTGD